MTNNPAIHFFVPVVAESPFPIQNLPFGVFWRRDGATHLFSSLLTDIRVLGLKWATMDTRRLAYTARIVIRAVHDHVRRW
jgi:hypothetical protein